eukprot:31307-Eustigmatos_ZCMA.PRE.1
MKKGAGGCKDTSRALAGEVADRTVQLPDEVLPGRYVYEDLDGQCASDVEGVLTDSRPRVLSTYFGEQP